jgi:dTDP-4-amino-4,6-dideoxygalactose transaminase
MDAIQRIAHKHDLVIIEDACQAVMASYKGSMAGSFGTGTFSFYATKNLMTGEGGMITTNDDGIAGMCRLIRQHGMKRRYYHECLGYNFRLTDIQAAIGLVQLGRLAAFTARRQENAAYFNARINSVETPKTREGYEHVWHQYTVKVNGRVDRDAAVTRLKDAGIGTGIYYPVPIHKQKSMESIAASVKLPVAEQMAERVFSLPVHPQLPDEALERIVAEVNRL